MIKQIQPLYVREKLTTSFDSINSPESVKTFWHEVIEKQPWFDTEKECVVVLCTDQKRRVKGYNLVSLGIVNESYAHPREIFRPIILSGATSFTLIHNHPSGDPSPSRADHNVTKNVKECANMFNIEFTDHVIVAGDSFFSFRESGLV